MVANNAANKTWDEKDWQAIDNEDREGGIVEEEDKKLGKGKQKDVSKARKIIGEGQRIINVQGRRAK